MELKLKYRCAMVHGNWKCNRTRAMTRFVVDRFTPLARYKTALCNIEIF